SGTPAPSFCPSALTANLTVNTPSSADNDTAFAIPINGIGLSALQPSVPEIDFAAQAPSQSSQPQPLSFTNQSSHPVQILGSAPCLNNPPDSGFNTLPSPLESTSPVAGLQVVSTDILPITPDGSTIDYRCDSDPSTLLANFRISSDNCTGML